MNLKITLLTVFIFFSILPKSFALQTIITGNLADPYSNGLVPMVCPLWSNNYFSARIGNWFVGGQSEKLAKRFKVTQDNSNFTFAYAVFLQDPIVLSQLAHE